MSCGEECALGPSFSPQRVSGIASPSENGATMAAVFASEAQKACFHRVVEFARESFKEGVEIADGAPLLSVRSGSAVTFVSVAPLTADDSVVTVRAYVVSHATITRELAVFLLVANTTTVFGAFGLSPQGDIVLEHNLIGSTLSRSSRLR